MSIPKELKYTNDHEWVKVDGDVITVGITEFAANELGDVVFIEVDEDKFAKEEVFGSIEAVKTVSDMLMPVSGEVIEVNEKLEDQPEIINSDCYGEGWIAKIKASDLSQIEELLTDEQYSKLIG